MTATLGLPRELRLTTKPAFDHVFDSASSSRDQYFIVLSVGNDLTHPRLGLVVSRKVSPRAVNRNRIRRVVRESFREHQYDLAACDLVVMAQPAARDADNSELRNSLERHWRKSTT